MDYKHLLISRLNVFYKTKMAGRGFDPDTWLMERVDIFKKFCFPSILNQSNKNFIWFFYIDAETPLEVRIDLEKTFYPYPFIKLISHQYESFNITKYLQKDIQKFLGDDFQYLISSRVDTDDMLHKDYMAIVQQKFKGQKYQALNFNKGFVYDVSSGVVSLMVHRYNAFLSLIENKPEKGFRTVFQKPHTDYRHDLKKIEVSIKQPMWCVTIHGLNDSTGFYGRVYKFSKPDLKENFGFQFQKSPPIPGIINYTIRSYSRTFQKFRNKFFL
ncbi:MAG: glycosyltransferase [Cyclobacteriaceae bacterium]